MRAGAVECMHGCLTMLLGMYKTLYSVPAHIILTSKVYPSPCI